jgi:3-oxoadipate enol-lactonase
MHSRWNPLALRAFLMALLVGLAGCASVGGGGRETGYVAVDGGRLYYEAAGAGEPVVFIHGFSLDTRMWDDQFNEFAKRYRVVRYDARGFGKSSLATGPFSTRADFKALLDRLELKQVHLVGLSMGGRYSVEIALDMPERLKSLTLIGSALGGFPTPEFVKQLVPSLNAAKAGNIAEGKRIWLAHPLFAPAAEQPAVAGRLKQIVDDYSGWHLVNGPGMHEQPLAPPAIGRLNTVRVPTLVISGTREHPELAQAQVKLAADIPGARHVMVAGAGHMTNMERPVEVNRALSDFLGAVK